MSICDKSKILITGANGFLGHHVVKAFRRYNKETYLTGVGGTRWGIKIFDPDSTSLNLLDRSSINAALWRIKPDIVIHLAAQCGGIGINRERPGEFLFNNLMMTTNLIEACRAWNQVGVSRVEKFVGIGTVCSYPKHTPIPFREENLFDGYPEETNAPYGIAKRVQLEMLKAYRTQYGLNGICLIPVNMAGEWDNFELGCIV